MDIPSAADGNRGVCPRHHRLRRHRPQCLPATWQRGIQRPSVRLRAGGPDPRARVRFPGVEHGHRGDGGRIGRLCGINRHGHGSRRCGGVGAGRPASVVLLDDPEPLSSQRRWQWRHCPRHVRPVGGVVRPRDHRRHRRSHRRAGSRHSHRLSRRRCVHRESDQHPDQQRPRSSRGHRDPGDLRPAPHRVRGAHRSRHAASRRYRIDRGLALRPVPRHLRD